MEDYLSALTGVPRGARFVRVRYQTPDLPERYGYHEIGRDPLFHLDAYAAARCACLDLSDYQAPNKIFPVIFNRTIDSGMLYGLWALEGPGPETGESLKWLRENLPVPIDYVILVADESSKPLAGEGLTKVLANLDSGMRLIAESRSVPFVHLYQRVAKR